MRCAYVMVVLAGCGRLGFDPVDDPGDPGGRFGRFVGAGVDQASAIAIDGDGNLYVTGYFGGTVDFGTGALTAAGARDGFVASYTADGVPRWSKQFGGAGDTDEGAAIAVTPAGEVAVGGTLDGTFDFGGGAETAVGSRDSVIVRYDRDGGFRWLKRFDDPTADTPYGSPDFFSDLAFDASGALVFGGSYGNALDVGGGALPAPAQGAWNIVLGAYEGDGAFRWAHELGDTRLNSIYHLAVDAGGHVYVTGYYEGTPSFGGAPFGYVGIQDAFVASFDTATGAHRWSRGDGGSGFDWGYAIGVAPSGDAYSAIRFETPITIGNQTYTPTGTQDMLLLGFAGDGALRFVRQLGGAGCEEVRAMAVAPTGEVYAVGRFDGTVDFGVASLTADEVDGFVMRMAPDGTPLSVQQIGAEGTDQIMGIAFSPDATAYIVGYYDGANDCGFGTDPPPPGSRDVFIERL